MGSSLSAFIAGVAAQIATQALRGIARQTVFHLKDYGPTGTADDSATFLAAITAAQSVNGVVYVPAGTYTCAPMTTGIAPFTLQGESMYTTVIKLKGSTNGFLFTFGNGTAQCSSIVLLNLTLDGNNPQQQSAGGCLNGLFAVHCNFLFTRFTQGTDVAVWLQGATGGAFGHNNCFFGCLIDNGRNNAVQTNNGQGIRTNSNDENFFVGIDLTYNGTSGGAEAFAVVDASGTNYWALCNFVGGANGFKLKFAPNPRVVGCHWDGVGGHALELQGTGAVISGCTFSRPGSIAANTYSAIYAHGSGGGHTVTGNQMTTDKTTSGVITRSFWREGAGLIPSVIGPNTVISGPLQSAYTNFGTSVVEDGGNGTRYHASPGMKTDAAGTASIAAGGTNTTVAHGVIGAPAVVLATPLADPGSRCWVSNITSTTFQINIQAALGSALQVAWHAHLFVG